MFVVIAAACSGASEPAANYTDEDIEYQLAALAGESLTDESIDRYAEALNRAETVCTEDRTLIGDIVFAAEGVAEEQGVDTSTLELLRALPESVPQEVDETPCADVAAALVTLMAGDG